MYEKTVNELILRFPWANKKQIAAMAHCCPATVDVIIKKENILYVPKTRFQPCFRVNKLLELSGQGLGSRKIAKELGTTRFRVDSWLEHYSIPTKTYFFVRKLYIPKDQLYHLYHKEEMTAEEIAKVYGLTLWNIYDYMNEYNIERNEPNLSRAVRDKMKDMMFTVEPEIGEVSDGALWLEEGEDIDSFF